MILFDYYSYYPYTIVSAYRQHNINAVPHMISVDRKVSSPRLHVAAQLPSKTEPTT